MNENNLISQDLVKVIENHLRRIRLGVTERQPFALHGFLISPEEEQEHIRVISDFLLTILLPSSYALCVPLRCLLKEILTCQGESSGYATYPVLPRRILVSPSPQPNVFPLLTVSKSSFPVLYPTIDMLCSPDYINLKLVSYLKWVQEEKERHRRTYEMTETFEDFVFIIDTCTDIEDLKLLRYKIVVEIMHATTLNNIKKQKGLSADKSIEPPTLSKGDLLLSRNLPKYIRQVRQPKTEFSSTSKELHSEHSYTQFSPNVKFTRSFHVFRNFEAESFSSSCNLRRECVRRS